MLKSHNVQRVFIHFMSNKIYLIFLKNFEFRNHTSVLNVKVKGNNIFYKFVDIL